MNRSKNVYRIPYVNGTVVKITNDGESHNPVGRIDMVGQEGDKPYKIVAAADGHIRFIVDSFSKQVDSSSGEPCTNNYVWIEHGNGEWTKYSHMQKGSTTKEANLHVGQFVKAGTFLGFEGKVGCASGSHLHFEVGVPQANDPITTTGGFLKDNEGSKRNRIPRICGIAGGVFVDGKSYTAETVPGNIAPGFAEFARHGVPAQDYQCLFDQAVSSNYELEWLDGYSVGGKSFFNAIWRPATGAWRSFVGQTADEYQDRFEQAKQDGFAPVLVESYLAGERVRYAAIFKKVPGAFLARHGLTVGQHDSVLDEAKADGLSPINVSVVSLNDQRFYTVLYRKQDIGKWQVKSQLDADAYQQAVGDNKAAGRKPVYVSAYLHQGSHHFSAIFTEKPAGVFHARHGLTAGEYQTEWQEALNNGLTTKVVSGMDGAQSKHLFVAVWGK
jgi:murein DD-endopeptidase MepM/ murein hydrolase activator NlpD